MANYTTHYRTPRKKEKQAIKLYLEFVKVRHISERLGISKSNIDRILKKNGIARNRNTNLCAMLTHRRCGCCDKLLPTNFFGKAQKHVIHAKQRSTCKKCETLKTMNWRAKNIDRARKTNREWARQRRATNPQYKVAQNLRRRIREVVALAKSEKISSSGTLVGCSVLDFMAYIESLWKPGMSWGNHGKYGWHIDHIKPCLKFDLTDPEQQKQCFHYTNLQPLWWRDNVCKRAKYIESSSSTS